MLCGVASMNKITTITPSIRDFGCSTERSLKVAECQEGSPRRMSADKECGNRQTECSSSCRDSGGVSGSQSSAPLGAVRSRISFHRSSRDTAGSSSRSSSSGLKVDQKAFKTGCIICAFDGNGAGRARNDAGRASHLPQIAGMNRCELYCGRPATEKVHSPCNPVYCIHVALKAAWVPG